MKKINKHFYECRKIFGRKRAIKPKIILWMIREIDRVLVWWKSMDREANRKTIEKVQRLAATGIVGTIKSLKCY